MAALALTAAACSGPDNAGAHGDNAGQPTVQSFDTRSDLSPVSVRVTTNKPGHGDGYVFVAPKHSDGQDGPMIIDDSGQVVWFRPMTEDGTTASNFRVQTYQGEPVLTWWEGTSERGNGDGEYVIMNSAYEEIARVRPVGDVPGDLHEFTITKDGTALITSYPVVTRDLTAIGGPADAEVFDGLTQEIDIATGELTFEWSALDHIDLSESYVSPDEDKDRPYDFFHINSVNPGPNDTLLISARHTHTVYDISREDGSVRWRLGGKRDDFHLPDNATFAWQHNAEYHPGSNTYTLFDNATNDAENEPATTRALVFRLNPRDHTATLLHEYDNPEDRSSQSQGNAQLLPNGDMFVGWGSQPYVTEFAPDGTVLYAAHFESKDSYRAFRFEWTGHPADKPAVVANGSPDGTEVKVSWNGATEVTDWELLAGTSPDDLRSIDMEKRDGFETVLTAPDTATVIAVRALDKDGADLGVSDPVQVS